MVLGPLTNQPIEAKHSSRLSLKLMVAMYVQVDILLLFGLIITRNDKVLPTSPIGINTGNQ